VTPTIVKLEPAGQSDDLWKVSVSDERGETPVDYMRLPAEARSFVGDGGYFEAQPDVDGWRLLSRAAEQRPDVRPDGTPFL
jgi:hypothetical protein